MAKSKYAPALFEVIDSHSKGKKKDSLALPKWWRNSTREKESAPDVGREAPPASQDGPAAAQQSVPVESKKDAEFPPAQKTDQRRPAPAAPVSVFRATAVTSAPPTKQPTAHVSSPEKSRSPMAAAASGGSATSASDSATADQEAEAGLWERLVHLDEGRVVLTLTPVNLSFVAGGVLIALFAAFMVGRSTQATPPSARDLAFSEEVLGVEAMRAKEPDPSVLGPGAVERDETGSGKRPVPTLTASSGGAGPDGGETLRSGRQVGLNYILLQYFYEGDREDAEHAGQWLASKGVETTLEPSSENNGWLLITTRGFDYHDPNGKPAAEEFREAIIRLGKQYRAEFGAQARYTFHDPMIRKEPGA